MSRADIKLADQLERRRNWKDPLVDAVVATFLVRQVAPEASVMRRWEFLVTERVKGAEKGQLQAHHGGFVNLVTDTDIYDGAVREVKEEVGYDLNPNSDLVYLTSVGPGLYRSELFWADDKSALRLAISSEEAEPTVGFVLPLFIADVTGKTPSSQTDGEVKGAVWMSAAEIVSVYGCAGESDPYSRFNYFQMLVPAILSLARIWIPGRRANLLPGSYQIVLP